MDSVPASPKRPAEEKRTFFQKVSDLIRKYRIALIAILGSMVLIVIVIAAWTGIRSAIVASSTAYIEKIEESIAAYEGEKDQAKKAELEKTLLSDLDAAAAKWPHIFAGQRALAAKARILASKKDWAGAEKEWLAATDALPSSYLAPIAIQEAAVAAEERGANESAKGHYERFLEKFPQATAGIPHARFALGRIAEESKDYAGAIVQYEKIVATYPDSDWTKLAKDRILFIKSRGLAE